MASESVKTEVQLIQKKIVMEVKKLKMLNMEEAVAVVVVAAADVVVV